MKHLFHNHFGVGVIFALAFIMTFAQKDALADVASAGEMVPYNPRPSLNNNNSQNDIIDVTDFEVLGFEELVQDQKRIPFDTTVSDRAKTDAAASNQTKSSKGNVKSKPRKAPQKDSWEQVRNQTLENFEHSHPTFFNKRQAKYFDGSRTFKKGKFTVVSLQYPSMRSMDERQANAFLNEHVDDVGGALLSRFKSNGKIFAEFLVPNETVSTFIAEQAASYGSKAKVVRNSSGDYQETIGMTVKFKELNEFTDALGGKEEGRLTLSLSTKEYRKLFKHGAMDDFKLRKLIHKKYKRLGFKRSFIPDVEMKSLERFQELPPKASLLTRLRWIPSNFKNRYRKLLGKKRLAKHNAKQDHIEAKASIKADKKAELNDVKAEFKLAKKEANQIKKSEIKDANMAIERDALLGKSNAGWMKRKIQKRRAAKKARYRFNKIVQQAKKERNAARKAIKARARDSKRSARYKKKDWKSHLAHGRPAKKKKMRLFKRRK